jgi:hypothetical protein
MKVNITLHTGSEYGNKATTYIENMKSGMLVTCNAFPDLEQVRN